MTWEREIKKMRRECDPLLRGGRREGKYTHGFSSAEMQSLASICEVLLPPLPLNSIEGQPSKAVQSFYQASGSQHPIPDEVIATQSLKPLSAITDVCVSMWFTCLLLTLFVLFLFFCVGEWEQGAELFVKRALIEAVILVRVVLIILSTRLGTLLLCGSLSFSDKWPFINNFSSISLEKREKILQRWFRHRLLTPIRLAFVYIKFLCLYAFFTLVLFLTTYLSVPRPFRRFNSYFLAPLVFLGV